MAEKKITKVEDIKADADNKECPVEQALFFVSEFLSGPMCGKCFPCSMGCYEAKLILKDLIEGKGTKKDVSGLRKIAAEMLDSSMCKKGKDTARFMLDWLDTDVFSSHVEGICPSGKCAAFIEYRIIPDKCTLCGICKDVCRYNAIHGEKVKPFQSGFLPFEVRQTKCVKCGDCINVCPEGAIIVIDIRSKERVEV